MASDTKQQTTYKKRVISESDDEDSSSGHEGDVPLARTAGTVTANRAAEAPALAKTASDEGKHNPSDVAAGSVLLKEAIGHGDPSQPPPHVEDAHSRHEIAAAGFPVDAAAASSATAAHTTTASGTNGQLVANDSKMGEDESSDDDKPLAVKATENGSKIEANGTSVALPSFTKSTAPAKSKQDDSSSDDGRPLALNFDKKPKKPSSKSKPKSSERKKKVAAVKDEPSSDEDVPLAKQTNGKAKKDAEANGMDVDDSSDEDTPLAAQVKPKSGSKKKRGKAEDSDFAEENEKPMKKAKKVKSETPSEVAPKGRGKAKAVKVKKEGLASPLKKLKAKVKAEDDDSQAAGGSQRDDDEEDDEYKWWKANMEEDNEDGDDGPKWTTLQHSGVLFPPEYVPLPPNVKLKYDGKPLDLPPESEEVAGFFAAMVETEHASDPVFRQNFFNDFLGVLSEFPPRNKVKIDPEKGMDRLNFSDMHQYYEIEKEKRKAMTKEEKKKAKEERDELEKPYKTCLIDGREEIVGNFRLEPPGLFRGRGQHPKKGKLKKRINASQITINIGKDAVQPKPPAGQQWGAVVHKQDVTWLANWQENVNNNFKYVFLAAGSSWKGQSDFKKYEKARELKKCIGRIRLDYERDLTSKVMADRQRATAVYFIDRFALRVGNEKGEEEADTVGCCSLRYEHITLAEPNLVTFDFLGKDSIRFYQPDKEVDLQVFKNLKLFKKGGKEGDAIFDRVKPDLLNKFFGTYMKGLSAKVFRTYNASYLLQQQLLNTPKDVSVADKLLHYNRANRLVAEMCNHQRAVSKTHGQAMEKLSDKVRQLKYQRMKLRYTLWTIDSDNKKKHKQYKEMESDLEDDWMEKHEEELVEKERAKIRKRWEKDNEKRKADGEKELTEKELNEMLEAADEFGKEIAEERKKKHVEPRKAQTTAKVLEAILKIDERIAAQKLQALDREEGKEVSLTTSKINYMDPRVTVAWCKKHGVPLDKLYSKTLRTKFVWAMEVDEDWEF